MSGPIWDLFSSVFQSSSTSDSTLKQAVFWDALERVVVVRDQQLQYGIFMIYCHRDERKCANMFDDVFVFFVQAIFTTS